MRKKLSYLIFFILLTPAQTTFAASNKNLQLRLDRLERMIENNSQYQTLSKIKQLKEENRELRGQVEEQSNLIKKLERRIHSLYSDMDRRLVAVETDTTKMLSAQVNKPPSIDDKYDSETTPPKLTETQAKIKTALEQSSHIETAEKKAIEADNKTSSSTLNNPPGNASKQLAEKQYAEQQAYQKAFEQLKALRYSKAEKSFSEFLGQFPDGRYAHIAQYWLAESNYAQRKFKQAIKDYQQLLNKHHNSPKKAEAHLKIAYCYYELGNKKKTRTELNILIKRYPNTTETGQAKRLLKRL